MLNYRTRYTVTVSAIQIVVADCRHHYGWSNEPRRYCDYPSVSLRSDDISILAVDTCMNIYLLLI